MPENTTAQVHQPSEVREFLEVVDALHDANEAGDTEAAYYLRNYLSDHYSIVPQQTNEAPADPGATATDQATPEAPADPNPNPAPAV